MCINYHKTFRVYKSRQDIDDEIKKKRVSDDSKTNYRYLKLVSKKDERLANLQKKNFYHKGLSFYFVIVLFEEYKLSL